MSLSRLLLAKPVLHFQGIPKSTRWCSYSSSSGDTQKLSHVKGFERAKENEHSETHLKVLPKETEIQTKVGGSWYSLKGILTNLKDKMFANSPNHEQINNETSHSLVDPAASEVIMKQEGDLKTDGIEHIAKSGGSKSLLQSSEISSDSNRTDNIISTCTTSHLQGKLFSEDTVDTTASEHASIVQVARASNRTEDIDQFSEATSISLSNEKNGTVQVARASNETENIDQFSEATSFSFGDEKNSSMAAASCISGKDFPQEMIQAAEISDNQKEDMLEDEKRLLEESTFSTVVESDSYQKKEVEHLYSFTRVLLDDAVETGEGTGTNELTSTINTKCQLEKEMPTFVQTGTGDSFKVEEKPPSFNGFQEDDGLVDLFEQMTRIEIAAKMGSTNGDANELTSTRNAKCQLEKETATIVQTETGDGHEKPPSFNGFQEDDGLVDLFKQTTSTETAAKIGSTNSGLLTPSESFSNLDFDGLMGYLKVLPGATGQDNALRTDQLSNTDSIDDIEAQDELRNFDTERGKTLSKGHNVGKDAKKVSKIKKGQSAGMPPTRSSQTMSKNDDGNLDIAAKDHLEFEQDLQVPLPTSKKEINQTPVACLAERHTKNIALLRFLHQQVEKSDIISSLRYCGPISKIKKVPSSKGSNFYDAFLHFKTKNGLQKALNTPEILIKNSNAFVEEASLGDTANKISIPNLIGDANIPIALVKHPTHTVKIKQLTPDISAHHLKEALSFCGSGVTGIFPGTSSSHAYVEFESEEAKERALAKHFIDVSGKQLLIFRIDTPRTTVVRIQNINPECYKNVLSICKTFGKVLTMKPRHETIVDVYFRINEWPNMLNILNSLNGLEVDGSCWFAQPAPIIPPVILHLLWHHPDETQHVKAVMHNLLRKVQHTIDTAELNDLAAKAYGGSSL